MNVEAASSEIPSGRKQFVLHFEFDYDTIMGPYESGEFIAENPIHLDIKTEGIDKLTEEIVQGIVTKQIDIANFSQHELHPKPTDAHAIDWIVLIDTLNFCFWTPTNSPKWQVEGYTGYFALCAAINRAMKEGVDITNPQFYSKITLEELSKILRSDDGTTKIALIEERVNCLHEVGNNLIEKYNGNFLNCIKNSAYSAQHLLTLIVTEFPCFRDEADYDGQSVSMYKRAQILIGDIWACYGGEDLGRFDDIDTLTMFADYRIPQVLVHFGALEYKEDLLNRLKKDEILINGDEEEVEIRCASIYIVEQVKFKVLNELQTKYPEISTVNLNSVLIDHFLWDYRRKFAKELEYIPFHKTISIYY